MPRMQMQRTRALPRRQRGSSLIEGLAALVIFSFGMLGLAGLKTQMMQQSSHAQLRRRASSRRRSSALPPPTRSTSTATG